MLAVKMLLEIEKTSVFYVKKTLCLQLVINIIYLTLVISHQLVTNVNT